MTFVKKLFTFLSLFLLYVIVREFFALYADARSVHPLVGYGVLVLISGFLGYFVILPLIQIMRIPRNAGPTRNPSKVTGLATKRVKRLRNNPHLLRIGFDVEGLTPDRDGFLAAVEALRPETERIRKKYVTQLFYSSSIAQNGFLDAILILSSSVNLVKDLFLLYHGRVSNKDLWTIAKKVYVSMAIGGSEGVEYATDELFSKLTSGGIKSIPFASKILGSVADGFVNAAMLTRISLITENYCTMLFIASERDLYPSIKTIVTSTRIITSDVIDRIFSELKSMAKEKTGQYVLAAVNPVGYILGRTMDHMADKSDKLSEHQRDILRESAAIAQNPIGYGIKKISDLFRNKRSDTWAID